MAWSADAGAGPERLTGWRLAPPAHPPKNTAASTTGRFRIVPPSGRRPPSSQPTWRARVADAAAAALLGRLATRAPAGAHLAGCQSAVEAVLDRLGVIGLPKVRATSIGSAGTERIA
jgi:hypothetical protein